MSTTFSRPASDVATAVPRIAIRSGGVPSTGVASPDPDGSCARAFCTAERNSRLPVAARTGLWRLVWRVALDQDAVATAVMASQDRIVVDRGDAWLLLDANGTALGRGRRGAGEVVVDRQTGRFYITDVNGFVVAHRLSDGARAFLLSAYGGKDFARALIAPSPGRMLVVSPQRPLPGHPPIAPFMSALEAFEIAEPARVDERGYLESVRLVSSLAGSTAHVLAAAHRQMLALASPDELHVADRDLTLQVALTGEFTPQWLSVDEDLRFHLVVQTAAGRMLWVVTTRGERVVHAPLPADFEPIAPPIVGYDHVVYLVAAGRIIAFTPAGAILWDRSLDASTAGAAVTVDRKLLVTSGAALDAADAQGQRERLFTAEGDVLVTAAAATPDGDLVVAGRQFLYRLRR